MGDLVTTGSDPFIKLISDQMQHQYDAKAPEGGESIYLGMGIAKRHEVPECIKLNRNDYEGEIRDISIAAER